MPTWCVNSQVSKSRHGLHRPKMNLCWKKRTTASVCESHLDEDQGPCEQEIHFSMSQDSFLEKLKVVCVPEESLLLSHLFAVLFDYWVFLCSSGQP